MRLPDWLLPINRRRRIRADEVRVEFKLDTTKFVDALQEAQVDLERIDNEGSRKLRYANRLELERQLGRVHVGELLDGLCDHFGFDPATTWRVPRAAEARARLRAALDAELASGDRATRQAAEAQWLRMAREHQAEQNRAREAP